MRGAPISFEDPAVKKAKKSQNPINLLYQQTWKNKLTFLTNFEETE